MNPACCGPLSPHAMRFRRTAFSQATALSELIWLTAFALVRPNDRVLVIGPTYGEYARSATLCHGIVHSLNARQEDRFALDPHEVEEEINRCRPHVVFLCNPNNPTGSFFASELILSWCKQHRCIAVRRG